MKQYISTCFMLLAFISCNKMEVVTEKNEFYVTAINGLVIRDKPSINGKKLGTIAHGSLINEIEKTELKFEFVEDGKIIKGQWVKVSAEVEILIEMKGYVIIEYEQKNGYVFNAYLNKEEPLRLDYLKLVKPIVDGFKKNDRDKIKTLINYPLSREYPLPSITNEEEFLERFDEVFDEELKNELINSDLNYDWSDVGWRGIMFLRGDLWLDYEGALRSISHQSKYEEKERKRLINLEKSAVHSSLNEFYEPVLICETDEFVIRIDELEKYEYRYAVWSEYKTQNDKPDLVITKRKVIHYGTGGNHHYLFKNGEYTYKLYVNVLRGSSTPLANLEVFKNDELILEQPAIKVSWDQ